MSLTSTSPPPAPERAGAAATTLRIRPDGVVAGTPLAPLRELWMHRQIIGLLVQRQLRLRYKGSFLGVFWSLAPPLVQVFVLTLLVGYVFASGTRNQSAYIFCAFLPWIFVSSSLPDAASAVLEHGYLLRKTYFPREILPISSVLANFVHFFVALAVFLVYRYGLTTLLFGWPGLPPREIVWLPVVILDMLLLTLGLSLLMCAWTTFFEDVKYLLTTGLQLAFYALPIMYFAEQIFYSTRGGHSHKLVYLLYLANPLAWIVTAFKQMFFSVQLIRYQGGVAIYTAPFDYRYFVWTTAVSIGVCVIGYQTFGRLKWKFAERP